MLKIAPSVAAVALHNKMVSFWRGPRAAPHPISSIWIKRLSQYLVLTTKVVRASIWLQGVHSAPLLHNDTAWRRWQRQQRRLELYTKTMHGVCTNTVVAVRHTHNTIKARFVLLLRRCCCCCRTSNSGSSNNSSLPESQIQVLVARAASVRLTFSFCVLLPVERVLCTS